MKNSELWIKKIEPEILQAANLPASMIQPAFPLDAFVETFAKALGLEDFSIKIGTAEWKTDKSYFSGLGTTPVVMTFQVAPLKGELCFLMGQEDVKKFTTLLRDTAGHPLDVDHPDLVKGLYRYILLQAFAQIKNLGTYGNLGFKLSEQANFEKSSFAIDVSLQKGETVLWGRLLIPSIFQEAFASHFETKRTSLRTIEKAKNVELPLSVIAGSVSLTREELSSLQEGDFIQIDNLYYNPKTKRGSYKVYMDKTPIFQAKIKEDTLKILDFIYAFTENHHG